MPFVLYRLSRDILRDALERRDPDPARHSHEVPRSEVPEPAAEGLPACLARLLERRVAEVAAVADRRVELADVLRRVLQVVIHHDDHVAGCMPEPRHDRVVLSSVAAQVDAAELRIQRTGLLKRLPGSVRAGVGDENHPVLANVSNPAHGIRAPPREFGHDARAVIRRNYNREIHGYVRPETLNT